MRIAPRVCTSVFSLTLGAHAQRGLQYLCLSVCFPYSGSTRDEKYNERYHRVKRQICGNIKMASFLKLSYSKVKAFPRQGRPSLVDAYILRVQCFVYFPLHVCLCVKHCVKLLFQINACA